MNQIINMILRRVMGQLINRGVNYGFDRASKMGKGKRDADVSPEEQARREQTGREQGKQARKSLKTMRRLGRF